MLTTAAKTPKMNVESLMATCPAIRAVVLTAALGRMESLGAGAVSMDDHDTALQAEQKLLISNVSNEALEKAAGGVSGAQSVTTRHYSTSASKPSAP